MTRASQRRRNKKHLTPAKLLLLLVVGFLLNAAAIMGIGYVGYQTYVHYTMTQQPVKRGIYTNHFSKNGPVEQQTMTSIIKNRRLALAQGVEKYPTGYVSVPSVGIFLPIFWGANNYTLSLGAAKDYYVDAEMGKGNYVLAGHNMDSYGVLFSNLVYVKIGDTIKLYGKDKIYYYTVNRNKVISPYVKLVNGKAAFGTPYYLPSADETPIVTLYDCADFGRTRRMVQGTLSKVVNKPSTNQQAAR